MDISKLKVGMTVKNYRELCRVLGVSISSGDSKVAQLKEFGRYIKYRKEGHKFVIEEVYKFPSPKEDSRSTSGSGSIYTLQFQQLLLDLLFKQNDKRLELISITRLLRSIEMVNNYFNRSEGGIEGLSNSTSIDKATVNDFYNDAQSTLKKHIETALRILDRKEILRYEIGMAVAVIEKVEPLNTDDLPRYEECHRRATRSERELILDIERITLEEFGASNRQQIYMSGMWSEFKRRINKQLKEIGNIMYYYNCYDIVYSEEAVVEELENIEIDEIKLDLNKKVIEQLNKGVDTNCKRARRNNNNGKFMTTGDKIKCDVNYEGKGKVLIDTTIAIDKLDNN